MKNEDCFDWQNVTETGTQHQLHVLRYLIKNIEQTHRVIGDKYSTEIRQVQYNFVSYSGGPLRFFSLFTLPVDGAVLFLLSLRVLFLPFTRLVSLGCGKDELA